MSGSYVVSFARSKPHPYFVWVTPLLYSILCYVRLCHDGTQLFGFRKINLVMQVQLLLSKFLWDTSPFQYKEFFPGMDISITKIRQLRDHLILTMGIHILVKQHHYTETVPWWCISTMSHHFFRNGLFSFVVCSMPRLHLHQNWHVNSLAPGRLQRNFRKVSFRLILVIDGWSISRKIALKWMPMYLTDGKSTLVQVMAWYLSQCWPRSLSPYGFIRPQWVNWNSRKKFSDIWMKIQRFSFTFENGVCKI